VDDLSKRTLRELLTLARERLGSSASRLKTRDEVLAALRGDEVVIAPPAPAPSVAPSTSQIIVRDFFRKPA